MASPLPSTPIMLACITLAAFCALGAPLLTYSLTLAVFGAAHVLTELRFVEARFSGRLSERLLWGIGAGLLTVGMLRLLSRLGVTPPMETLQLELFTVTGLAALTLPALWRRSAGALLVGLLVTTVIGVGVWAVPLETILILACLHNWTPVGFLAEALPEADWRRGMGLALLAFVGVPAVIFAVGPMGWLDFSVLPTTGTLADNLGAWLPPRAHDASWAAAVFATMAYAQCMHYAVVIGVLPRLVPPGPDADHALGLSRLPVGIFVGGVIVLSAALLVGYGLDFREARGWYGVLAAVHAWLEVPVLLLALTGPIARGHDSQPAAGAAG
ncbi:MAG: hypothetical protein AAFV53_20320 [Myxococcota bacterium]